MPKFYSRDVWKTRYTKQNSTHTLQNLVTFRKMFKVLFQTWQFFLKGNLWIGISFTSYLHETITETSQSFLTSSSRRANRFNWTENKQKHKNVNLSTKLKKHKTQNLSNIQKLVGVLNSRYLCDYSSKLETNKSDVDLSQELTDRTFSRGDSSKMSVVGPSSFRSDLRVEFKNFKSFVDPRSKLTMKLG